MKKGASCLELQRRPCLSRHPGRVLPTGKGLQVEGPDVERPRGQGTCCSQTVQFASVRLLGRAVVGDKARGLDRWTLVAESG